MSNIDNLLKEIESIVNNGVDDVGVEHILKMICLSFPSYLIKEMKLYSDYLPVNNYTEEKRYLHFLWDALDKSPMCLVANFAIPFRKIIAKKLFKSCGDNFIAEENVRFNIPDNIEIGDNVFMNKGSFIDSKGGVKIGNSVGIGEGVTIFSHSHTEHDHSERLYASVVINDYVKIYSYSTILPSVTLGEQSIVAAHSLVNNSTEPNALVAGSPAKFLRDRNTNGNLRDDLKHYWLKDSLFQEVE